MKFQRFIATRYMLKRKGLFAIITTLIGVAGVSVGVAALITTLAVMTGFQTDIKDKIVGAQSHILVFGRMAAEVYPEKIKGNVHAQAFYGVITAILDDVMDINANIDMISDISLRITEIVDAHNMVDWQTNKDIHNKIAQDIDDMFYEIEKDTGIIVDFNSVDKIIENVKTVALRRF